MAQRFLVPEWAPQDAVLLTWPHLRTDWAPVLESVEPVYIELTRQISLRERVLIICLDDTHRANVADKLHHASIDLDAIDLFVVPTNDTWVRDYGPLTIHTDSGPKLLDFNFNGWGGKYRATLDDRVTHEMHHLGAFGTTPLVHENLVLEGGAIDTDGAGSLLSTTRCLQSGTRNPSLDKPHLQAKLQAIFGLQQILWLEHGYLEGDDTDGHIDNLARFCNETTITYTACEDPDDPHYSELQAMASELRGLRNAEGKSYALIPLPLPAAKYDAAGRRLPASYANFLIINEAALLPVYDDPADDPARERLAEALPERDIIPIDCQPLIQQNGSLHCSTLQLPKGVLETD